LFFCCTKNQHACLFFFKSERFKLNDVAAHVNEAEPRTRTPRRVEISTELTTELTTIALVIPLRLASAVCIVQPSQLAAHDYDLLG
jgi:hypothetical protein